MAGKNKKKASSVCNNELNDSFKTTLIKKQNEYDEEVEKRKHCLINYQPALTIRGSEMLIEAITKNMPDNFLDMNYKEFILQMGGTSFANPKLNDTLVIIKNLRNKVTSGTASHEEIIKYQEVKKLL